MFGRGIGARKKSDQKLECLAPSAYASSGATTSTPSEVLCSASASENSFTALSIKVDESVAMARTVFPLVVDRSK